MRIALAPSGSRGDFQPMLALAVGLIARGHQVSLVTSPNFEAEARAFGVPFAPMGFDVERFVKEQGFEASPLRGSLALLRIGRRELPRLIDEMLPAVKGYQILVGAGAQVAGPTVAERLGIPYAYVAYTAQALRSTHHAPFAIPLQRMPRAINRLLWWLFEASVRLTFAGPLDAHRRTLDLGPVRDQRAHFYPPHALLLACDPVLSPVPPDAWAPWPPAGGLHLADERPLPEPLQRFLDAGTPPIYVGFGSMPDRDPARTTALFVAAARAVGARLVLSSGWARFGEGVASDDVFVCGPASHALLFPRVRAVVHHGGAGTTAAALRAGKPQVVVPHAFDQLDFGRRVHEVGVGPAPIGRRRLTAARLTEALHQALTSTALAARAAELGERARARDAVTSIAEIIESIAR